MKRVRVIEEMDQPQLDPASHQHALTSLARANRFFGFDRRLRNVLRHRRLINSSIVDLGCADSAILNRLTAYRGRSLIGIDRSEFALRAACLTPSIRVICADVRRIPLSDGAVDVALCSLLLHHLDPDDACAILSEAARIARKAVIVSDLTRSFLSFYCTWIVTRMISRSWVFHIDGPRSVRAAYTQSEMRALADRAGLRGATINTQFPFRMLLEWHKPMVRESNAI